MASIRAHAYEAEMAYQVISKGKHGVEVVVHYPTPDWAIIAAEHDEMEFMRIVDADGRPFGLAEFKDKYAS